MSTTEISIEDSIETLILAWKAELASASRTLAILRGEATPGRDLPEKLKKHLQFPPKTQPYRKLWEAKKAALEQLIAQGVPAKPEQ